MSGARYDGKQWGDWLYRHATLTLALWKRDVLEYEVDLERCNDSGEILDWIIQVSERLGVTPTDVGYLVRALDELGEGLQGTVCPGGQNQHFDFGAFLRGQ